MCSSVSLGLLAFALLGVLTTFTEGNDGLRTTTQAPGTTPRSGSGYQFPTKAMVFTTIKFEPYLMETTDPEVKGNDRFSGFIADLVKELATRLDFKYELRLVADSKWGSRDQHTGLWNGMIGEVIRGEAMMAVSPITISNIRKSMVDFTVSWQNVSLSTLVNASPKDGSTVPADLDGLLAANYTFGTISESSTEQALMSNSDPRITRIWSLIASHKGAVPNVEEGKLRASRGKYAFIVEKPTAEYVSASDCRLKTVGDFLPKEGYAFPVQRGSRALPKFNAALVTMKNDGTLAKLQKKWWTVEMCSGADVPRCGGGSVLMMLVVAVAVMVRQLSA